MTGPTRDWDKEMAEIDKILAKDPTGGRQNLPAKQGGAAPPQRSDPGMAPATRSRRSSLTGWVRVILGVLVAVGVTQWPYQHACGFSLYLYLGAAGGVMLAGLWGVITSWRRRMGLAHTVSLLVTLWGALLIGRAALDRSTYAKHPAVWTCQ